MKSAIAILLATLASNVGAAMLLADRFDSNSLSSQHNYHCREDGEVAVCERRYYVAKLEVNRFMMGEEIHSPSPTEEHLYRCIHNVTFEEKLIISSRRSCDPL